ncbi:MAG: NUDIX domain-containing protein [Bdellovibrionota bacterium]
MPVTSDSAPTSRKKAAAPKISAGIMLFRQRLKSLEIFLGHPGGPFFAKKDLGSWTIPKGGLAPSESPEDGARREFLEEVGFSPTDEESLIDLGQVKQRSGKTVRCFACKFGQEDEWIESKFHSQPFTMEWPPKSGRTAEFPELDQARFFPVDLARKKILPSQAEFIERLISELAKNS